MYYLRPEAGGRWTGASHNEAKELELFQRYIQSIERSVDLVTSLLTDVLGPDYREFYGKKPWLCRLSSAAQFLEEQAATSLEEIAPHGYETLVRYYNLYARACGETNDAIEKFLHGQSGLASIDAAFSVLQAHDDARDVYLESIQFPAWL